MARDNIAGTKGGFLATLFLFPGAIVQWLMYMCVGNIKGYAKVRAATRQARSPLIKWLISLGFWAFCIALALEHYGIIEPWSSEFFS